MLRVEHDDAELLDRQAAVLRQQVRREIAWRAQLKTFVEPTDQRSSTELDGGGDLDGTHGTDTGHALQLAEVGAHETVQPADRVEHAAGDIERVRSARADTEHDREQLVIAERGRTEARQLLAWTFVRCHIFHLYSGPMYRWSPRAMAAQLLVSTVLITACAAPPNRELGDAEQALKSARAAGAERYAPESYQAAADAYRLANEAVTASDYRLALNRALESREHSKTATREAAEARAQARDVAMQTMTEVTGLLTRVTDAADTAERSRAPRGVMRDVRQALTLVETDVQKAGAAIEAEEYDEAETLLAMTKARLEAALADLEAGTKPQRSKRTRR